ncbi:MAG: SRPBCC family protein [Dehalococcoidia bacterium]
MFHTRHEVDIEAPPARVWAIFEDVARWPDWTPTVTAVELLDAPPLRVGFRARLTQPGRGPAVWQVTEVAHERSFTWQTRAGGMIVSGLHALEPRVGGTRLTLAIEATGLGALAFGWLAARASRRNLPLEAAGLKRAAEASS